MSTTLNSRSFKITVSSVIKSHWEVHIVSISAILFENSRYEILSDRSQILWKVVGYRGAGEVTGFNQMSELNSSNALPGNYVSILTWHEECRKFWRKEIGSGPIFPVLKWITMQRVRESWTVPPTYQPFSGPRALGTLFPKADPVDRSPPPPTSFQHWLCNLEKLLSGLSSSLVKQS